MSRLQGYENVGHVLEEVRAFHGRLAEHFGALGTAATDARAGMLLEFLQRRSQNQIKALEDYEDQAVEGVLRKWFQIPFPEDLGGFFRDLDEDADLGVDEVFTLASRADELLMNLLEHMLGRVNDREVQSLFEDMLKMERQEQIALSKAMNSFREF